MPTPNTAVLLPGLELYRLTGREKKGSRWFGSPIISTYASNNSLSPLPELGTAATTDNACKSSTVYNSTHNFSILPTSDGFLAPWPPCGMGLQTLQLIVRSCLLKKCDPSTIVSTSDVPRTLTLKFSYFHK